MSNSDDGQPEFWALLVGVNDYLSDRITDLRGCENDILAIEKLLVHRFGVPPENIVKRLDTDATHAGVVEAFRSHLIGHAEAWADGHPEGAQTPPGFLYYFSGHGSQAAKFGAATEDKLVETTVLHDSRTEGVHDLKDWQLGGLLDELGQFTENITAILDCCHSGSGTRAVQTVDENGNLLEETVELGAAEVTVRGCETDLHDPDAAPPAATTRGTGERKPANHVLLAGCANHQLSHETLWRSTDAKTGIERSVRHGALSYHLVRELDRMRPDRILTYRELYRTLRRQVNSQFETQTPQCEGDRDREVFGGFRPQSDAFFAVAVKGEPATFTVDGGLVHGMAAGTLLAVYPPEVRQLAEAGEPLGLLRVVEPGAVESRCEPHGERFEIPDDAKVAVQRAAPGEMVRTVALAIGDPEIRAATEAELKREETGAYVRVAPAAHEGEFRVALTADRDGRSQLEIQDGGGVRLVAPYPSADSWKIARDLAHLARFHNLLDLRNADSVSRLHGAIQLRLLRQSFDSGGDPIASGMSGFKYDPLEEADSGEIDLRSGDRVALEIKNSSDRPLYVTVFSLGCDHAVGQLYPEPGTNKAIAAGQTFVYGERKREADRTAIRFGLPSPWPEGIEYLKAIATEKESDFSMLSQPGLRSPFERTRAAAGGAGGSALTELLSAAMLGGRPAFREDELPTEKDDWTTAELRYRLLP